MTAVLTENPVLLPVKGICLGACRAGIYKKNRSDLAIIAADKDSSLAAVFTRNAFCAAPVILARKHINRQPSRYCIINSGNANAGLGEKGLEAAMEICKKVANTANCPVEAVLPFSTGVIGEPIPVDNICQAIPGLIDTLTENAWLEVATAIMTTDTKPKGITRQIKLSDNDVTVTGIVKGSGMIQPNMATMLAFIATDAAVKTPVLQTILEEAVETTFNRISVDGDTSTNDACVLIATGKSNIPAIDTINDVNAGLLKEVIVDVCRHLAQAVVRDGEGATKFITLDINGGRDNDECREIAMTIAQSPLVKTALFASDPNWGRILAAIGRANINNLDVNRIDIFINEICIVKNGKRNPDYNEEQGKTVFKKNDITIRIDLKRANACIEFWTCDLSYDYVRINAEYRT